MPVTDAYVRRARHLVTYWETSEHRLHNYATGAIHPATPVAVEILDVAGRWTSREAIVGGLPHRDRAEIHRMVDELLEHTLLEATDRPSPPADRTLAGWGGWNPVAGFFHCATRPLPPASREGAHIRARRVAVERGYPSVLKEYPERPRLELPPYDRGGELVDVLLRRRTWRSFGSGDLGLGELSALMGLTFGAQRWVDLGGDRQVVLKTSPSGGARHSIEAYVLAFRVEGLENGTYHYGPDAHTLAKVVAATPRSLLEAFIPTQTGFHNPAALILMTSVFERVQWKYRFPRAYRVVLLDAGHLGQTFALVATSLGLAPFCTAALDDPLVEEHLGIDGIREGVVFAVGVGRRPEAVEWAPMHEDVPVPPTWPPSWTKRFPE